MPNFAQEEHFRINKAYEMELKELSYCRERLRELCPGVSDTLLDALALDWRIVYFDKREHLIRSGSMQADAFLIIQGLVRAYYPDIEEDITINFIAEGDFATHYTSLEAPRPSRFSFQTIEPTIAVAFSYDNLKTICRTHPEAERLLRMLVEYEYARALTHAESLLMRSAEDRYRLFVDRFGYLLARISVTDLASYLGVSRQNLTLIRKRLLSID